MSEIVYPPKCPPLQRNLHELLLEDRLKKLLHYFAEFSHERDDIYKYYMLWSELSSLSEEHPTEVVFLLATCVCTEICKNFILVPEQRTKNVPSNNFQTLYRNAVKVIGEIEEDDYYYTWKFHLLGRFTEQELFRLTHFNACFDKNFSESAFATMFSSLIRLGSCWEVSENVYKLVTLGMCQLVESAGECVHVSNVLKEVLLPFFDGSARVRKMVEKCIPFLKLKHFHTLCAIINHRIVLKETSELFCGKELQVVEKVIMNVKSAGLFDSIIVVLCKDILNHYHPDHIYIVRLLCALLVRYTEKTADKWKFIDLDDKKVIQLMVSRLTKIMTRANHAPYVNILLDYGSKLMKNAPCVEIKFEYFKIFKSCIKSSSGEKRKILIKMFDKYLKSNNSDIS